MFTLYMQWEAKRKLAPGDIQFILTPREALEMASIFYELDYLEYDQRYPLRKHSVPRRRQGVHHRHAAQPYKRKRWGEYDGLYDEVKWNLEHGWMVAVNTREKWDKFRNPFYFDGDSNLIYDCFMNTYGESFPQVVRQIYEFALNEHQGRKPPPTVKMHYSDAPIQHAQAAKTINSKAAGRLLAASGLYHDNIEGFHHLAEQLGGDAPAGYDQVMDNKGLIIAGASVSAGLGLGRLGAINEIEALTEVSKGDADVFLPTGRMGNPMNTVGANSPTTIGNFDYSAHAIDRMQGRGVPPSAIENAIVIGSIYPTKAGTTGYYDSINNLRVIINARTGNVITVIPGAPK